jgi:hypothetical protein
MSHFAEVIPLTRETEHASALQPQHTGRYILLLQ